MYCPKPTIRDLIEKTGSNEKDSFIQKAFSYAEEVYTEEKRVSGEPFIQHSLNTAMIASELGLDEKTVASALLHNVLYKGKTTEEELRNGFGDEVADMVIGITKINSIIERNRKKIELEVLSKLILATAKDMRAIFIKLADVLDSLRCIDIFNEKRRNEIAREALLLYSPICHKFGLTKCRWEIEDLAFKQLDGKSYSWIKGRIKERREAREEKLNSLLKEVRERLEREGIKVEVNGRTKHFYGIKQKMQKYKFNDIHDLLAIRIICDSVRDCYAILGIIHSMYEPITDCFDDYIANPKPNNYRSIHTDLRKGKEVFEAQIRTGEMHNEAEEGSPAHWIYKRYREDKDFDKKITWTRQLMELTKKSKKAREFIDSLNLDFGKNKVFVLTPRGEVTELAEGSTPIDFAFNIHSEIGRTCEKAKVNGKIVPLNYVLENGDEVEIITSKKQVPKRQWLSFVKTSKAISKIRQVLSLPELPK
ncbi:RelA/SpoT family protein, partial [Candidatus Micrarchaeota archaeon]|nr:RelA/SpoT family protein [Candidatus Micrarchaeota archaeon]